MSQTLTEIAKHLVKATKEEGKKFRKTQLIYAFNGTGKTRLSREFKEEVDPKRQKTAESPIKFMYYNAYTEDLFHWDNDLPGDTVRKLLVHPNNFTDLAISFLKDENQHGNITTNFQRYTNRYISPNIDDDFTEITFSYLGGDSNSLPNIKISKGEESNFIWCVFYTLIDHIISLLNEDKDERSSDKFNNLEYVFIDDPVSSLDDNHLVDLAVDLSRLIKKAKPTNVKFIISTHNPLFYNVLWNELNRERNIGRYRLQKLNDGKYLLEDSNDSPFSYHIFLLGELNNASITRNIHKYHFNLLRNVLEKTSTYLGFSHWEDLIPLYVNTDDVSVAIRYINLNSHSKHSGEEMGVIQEVEKDMFIKVFKSLLTKHNFKLQFNEIQVIEAQPEIPQLQDATV